MLNLTRKSQARSNFERRLSIIQSFLKTSFLANFLARLKNKNKMAQARDKRTPEQIAYLRANNRSEYVRLYKEHYGFEPKFD